MRAFLTWLPFAVVITVICALVYVTVQQNFRQSANDPQIQIAEDLAVRLRDGKDPSRLIGAEKVDLRSSLSPFVIVFDASDRPVASSALLDGEVPRLPRGVLAYAREHGENRVSWQPHAGVRHAVVAMAVGGVGSAVVVAGRSLREVENREEQLRTFIAAAWLAALLFSLGAVAMGQIVSRAEAGGPQTRQVNT